MCQSSGHTAQLPLPLCALVSPAALRSTGLSWMLDLHTQRCTSTSGLQTSRTARAWSPSTANVTLTVSVGAPSNRCRQVKHHRKDLAYKTAQRQRSEVPAPHVVFLLKCFSWVIDKGAETNVSLSLSVVLIVQLSRCRCFLVTLFHVNNWLGPKTVGVPTIRSDSGGYDFNVLCTVSQFLHIDWNETCH